MRTVAPLTLTVLLGACDGALPPSDVPATSSDATAAAASDPAPAGDPVAEKVEVPPDKLKEACESDGYGLMVYLPYETIQKDGCTICGEIEGAKDAWCNTAWPNNGMMMCSQWTEMATAIADRTGGPTGLNGAALENFNLLSGYAKQFKDCVLDATPDVLARLCKQYPGEGLAAYYDASDLPEKACEICKDVEGADDMFCVMDWPTNDVPPCSMWDDMAAKVLAELGVDDAKKLPVPANHSYRQILEWREKKHNCE